jgi:hypothetical protein
MKLSIKVKARLEKGKENLKKRKSKFTSLFEESKHQTKTLYQKHFTKSETKEPKIVPESPSSKTVDTVEESPEAIMQSPVIVPPVIAPIRTVLLVVADEAEPEVIEKPILSAGSMTYQAEKSSAAEDAALINSPKNRAEIAAEKFSEMTVAGCQKVKVTVPKLCQSAMEGLGIKAQNSWKIDKEAWNKIVVDLMCS